MSRSPMILRREITPGTIFRGMLAVSASTPSTRKRTRMSRPSGSKWMSEAPSSTACAITEFTSLMTGASSARSTPGPSTWMSVLSSGSSSMASATASSRRFILPMSIAMSSAGATTGRTSCPVMSRTSSSARMLAGSATATCRTS